MSYECVWGETESEMKQNIYDRFGPLTYFILKYYLVPQKPNNVSISITNHGKIEAEWEKCICDKIELQLYRVDKAQSRKAIEFQSIEENKILSQLFNAELFDDNIYYCEIYATNKAGKGPITISNILITSLMACHYVLIKINQNLFRFWES